MSDDYVIRVTSSLAGIDPAAWDALVGAQAVPSPFMRHAYLSAMHDSGCATPATGWEPHVIALWQRGGSATDIFGAACVVYLKLHSRGEYVFDWAWANAHAQLGLDYYPKALVAVPFTPVPGTRLLARDAAARQELLRVLLDWCKKRNLSSLHLLYLDAAEAKACMGAGLTLRDGVQFHWQNQAWSSFDDFLASLRQDKRKKIRQERRKVQDAGVQIRWARGTDISAADWDFFYRCYLQTYREHGNPPYLNAAFFDTMARDMPEHWLLFVAEHGGQPLACSLIGLSDPGTQPQAAYGRYWGAVHHLDCLHFEMCYYQPLQWCVAHGVQRFEGGAQGEHKMARALLPAPTVSAHWLAHPGLSRAVEHFLSRESAALAQYREELDEHSPLRKLSTDL